VERITVDIAREYAGLSLGIITMARTMRAVVDICEWKNALEELEESKVRKDDLEPDVFHRLRFSYNHLVIQQCNNVSCTVHYSRKTLRSLKKICVTIQFSDP
jgi:disease resistance protein RPS2